MVGPEIKYNIFIEDNEEIANYHQNELKQQDEDGRQRPPRRKTKSVVSQIHECALRLRMVLINY